MPGVTPAASGCCPAPYPPRALGVGARSLFPLRHGERDVPERRETPRVGLSRGCVWTWLASARARARAAPSWSCARAHAMAWASSRSSMRAATSARERGRDGPVAREDAPGSTRWGSGGSGAAGGSALASWSHGGAFPGSPSSGSGSVGRVCHAPREGARPGFDARGGSEMREGDEDRAPPQVHRAARPVNTLSLRKPRARWTNHRSPDCTRSRPPLQRSAPTSQPGAAREPPRPQPAPQDREAARPAPTPEAPRARGPRGSPAGKRARDPQGARPIVLALSVCCVS